MPTEKPSRNWPKIGVTLPPRPALLPGRTHKIRMGCGIFYVTLNTIEFTWGRYVGEVFIRPSVQGDCCYQTIMDGLGRLISVGLRAGVHVDVIVAKLRGLECPDRQPGGPEAYLSCLDAVARLVVAEDEWLKTGGANDNYKNRG